MTPNQFGHLVEEIRQYLEALAASNPSMIAACKNGEDFEVCVYDATVAVLGRKGIHAEIQYAQGSHTFPDIVLIFDSGDKYGIEVKSSTSTGLAWKINGNSVLGSTKEDVIDTYVMFGKTAMGHQAFRCKRYEDCVADVAVTHSPRYRIDMELESGTTFFDKSGLSYQQISSADNPIELITNYFRSLGQHAWWLAESTPAAIRMFSDLTSDEKKDLLGYCFAHFPEVFSSSASKFSRCAMWLASEHSIVSSSLRDNFSAGGKFEFKEFGRISRIYKTLDECKDYVLKALEDATIEELYADWGWEYRESYADFNKVIDWMCIAANNCPPMSETGFCSIKLFDSIMQNKK